MQHSLELEDATELTDRLDRSIALGKGLRLELENGREARAVLYRGDFPIKTVDLGDKVAKKLFLTEAIELGANQSRLAAALDVSRQTLHNYRQIKAHFGVRGSTVIGWPMGRMRSSNGCCMTSNIRRATRRRKWRRFGPRRGPAL